MLYPPRLPVPLTCWPHALQPLLEELAHCHPALGHPLEPVQLLHDAVGDDDECLVSSRQAASKAATRGQLEQQVQRQGWPVTRGNTCRACSLTDEERDCSSDGEQNTRVCNWRALAAWALAQACRCAPHLATSVFAPSIDNSAEVSGNSSSGPWL